MHKRKITLGMLGEYIAHLQEQEKSFATRQKYRHDILDFMGYIKGRVVTKELTMAYKEQLKKAYEPSSINSMLAAINGLLGYLGWQDVRVKRLSIQRKIFCDEKRELSKQEYLRLLAAARSPKQQRINLIVQTICATGIRVSELKHITAQAVADGQAVVECKGKVRLVFLPKKLQKLLGQYMRRGGIKAGPVFVTRSGKPIGRVSVWREMKALCDSAGVAPSKVFPHNLRHLFARTFYGNEKDIAKLADILGHSSVETTRGYIVSTGKEHLRQVERLGLVMGR